MQLVDELGMIYTACLMGYATFAFGRSKQFQIALGTFLVALALGVTGYYHYLQDPAFHQATFAALSTIIVFRCVWVMEVTLRPRWKSLQSLPRKESNGTLDKGSNSTNARTEREKNAKDAEILQTMWVMVAVGLSTFLLGFYIWHLDNTYCSKIRSWRRQMGLPWGLLLEGHGWW